MAKEIIISAEQLSEIAENLDMGLECYFDTKTSAIKTVIAEEFAEREDWEDDMREIEKSRSDLFQFKPMTSNDMFNVMLDFATHEVDDEQLQEEFLGILDEQKPFKNFKWAIDESDYRSQWFEYKGSRYVDFVSAQIL